MRERRNGRLAAAVVAAAGMSLGGGPRHALDQAPDVAPPRVIEIAAERFTFTPSLVEVPLGATLEIRLRSDDTNHGFRIVGTDVNVEIPKRGRGDMKVTFAPPRAGRYTFECSHVCGAGHSFMRGVIVVSEPGTETP
jgi:cytochrome c oxidase subunit 2